MADQRPLRSRPLRSQAPSAQVTGPIGPSQHSGAVMAVNEQASAAQRATSKPCTSWATPRNCARRMSGFSNFAVSFTIISILSVFLTLYGFGIATQQISGRDQSRTPLRIRIDRAAFIGTSGWPGVLALPPPQQASTSTPPDYAERRRLRPRPGTLHEFDVLSKIAATRTASTSARRPPWTRSFAEVGLEPPRHPVTILHLRGRSCCVHGLLNTVRRPARRAAERHQRVVARRSAWLLIVGGAASSCPTQHQSASFVFGHFVNNTRLARLRRSTSC